MKARDRSYTQMMHRQTHTHTKSPWWAQSLTPLLFTPYTVPRLLPHKEPTATSLSSCGATFWKKQQLGHPLRFAVHLGPFCKWLHFRGTDPALVLLKSLGMCLRDHTQLYMHWCVRDGVPLIYEYLLMGNDEIHQASCKMASVDNYRFSLKQMDEQHGQLNDSSSGNNTQF